MMLPGVLPRRAVCPYPPGGLGDGTPSGFVLAPLMSAPVSPPAAASVLASASPVAVTLAPSLLLLQATSSAQSVAAAGPVADRFAVACVAGECALGLTAAEAYRR